ncbi:septal ring lytic transglycosylase RlpA family lipoprotein [Pleomorphomonas diazotrophica]|uniref:Endolytic peptidoglycan transglycosylase RlpA n=1 Tax=Pleomorphomonas diazotrophica TaxID=1166257 RepID=A0A1I4R2D1_9HYPH|nr:septal ring lytic transglycosylase RlpA family lipoprotein [Pleomorphomonas diazotrophica]SFM46504.1 rare lipoprotein A [Pleomorphomonas diazotrophica]
MLFKTSAARAFFTAAMAVAFFNQAAPALAQCGKASWYAERGRTASGERMKVGSRTAAHRTLPFGTLVEVENLRNGRTVVVRINDRGPFIKGRVIDLARTAANELGMVSSGTANVRLSVLGGKDAPPAKMCG